LVTTTESLQRALLPAPVWPPDDTEESVVGTDLHQMTIANLRVGINEVAHTQVARGQVVPWQALSQIMVRGFPRRDGPRLAAYPDVAIYAHPVDQTRGSLALTVDGPPALIIEVLSEETYDGDLDLEEGKGYCYAHAGVREYLMLDPTGGYLPEQGRGWRLVEGVYRPWLPAERGRWYSETLALAIGLEGVLATVYTPEGRPMLREGEIEEELVRRDDEVNRLKAELDRLRRFLDEQGRQP
jgi:hypothetical protein